MKKLLIIPIFILLAVFYSCNDPIFFMISKEVPKIEPLIKGSPTNFVVFNGDVYVASGTILYKYRNGIWDSATFTPGGRIMSIAVANTYIYALCIGNDDKVSIKRAANPASWSDVPGINSNVQSFYAINNQLFFGSRNNDSDSYSIYHIDTPSVPITDLTNVSMLRGVAFDGTFFYICTDNGIYHTTGFVSATLVPESNGKDFIGIIGIGSTNIVAITRSGVLYSVTSGGVSVIADANFTDNRYATGALTLWGDNTTPNKLLLVGRQDINYSVSSGYTYGYVEIKIVNNEISGSFNEPGIDTLTTVSDINMYVSSIGKNHVNHLFQAPFSVDQQMRLFASTQKNGVWSYKVRNGVLQWNAED